MDADEVEQITPLTRTQRFWRNRAFARFRHSVGWFRRTSGLLTRAHAFVVLHSGGRIRRSYLFTGGMPILILTTVGRKTGKKRSIPLGYLRFGDCYAVIAGNAGNDRVPAWWRNLQADPIGHVLADRSHHPVTARRATDEQDEYLWNRFRQLNPGFDEYRTLTRRRLPIVLLQPRPDTAC